MPRALNTDDAPRGGRPAAHANEVRFDGRTSRLQHLFRLWLRRVGSDSRGFQVPFRAPSPKDVRLAAAACSGTPLPRAARRRCARRRATRRQRCLRPDFLMTRTSLAQSSLLFVRRPPTRRPLAALRRDNQAAWGASHAAFALRTPRTIGHKVRSAPKNFGTLSVASSHAHCFPMLCRAQNTSQLQKLRLVRFGPVQHDEWRQLPAQHARPVCGDGDPAPPPTARPTSFVEDEEARRRRPSSSPATAARRRRR